MTVLVISVLSVLSVWQLLTADIFRSLIFIKTSSHFHFARTCFKGARTLRPRTFCRVIVYVKLLVVQLSNLHKTLKSSTTSMHPKNHKVRTNSSYFISSWISETKNNRTQEPFVLAAWFFLYGYSLQSDKVTKRFLLYRFYFSISFHTYYVSKSKIDIE